MNDEGRRPPEGPRRRHHIASVAHHFLSEDDALAAGQPRPRSVVVAAADPLPATAFAAAGAARTGAIADGRRWRLLEDAHAQWSASTHVGQDDRVVIVPSSAFTRTAAPVHGLSWHLGAASPERLDAWAGACSLPGCGLPTAGTRVHLLWCLAAEQAGAMAPLVMLARVAALLEPERLDLLVAPRAWPHHGREGSRPEPADADLVRLQRRAATCTGLVPGLGVVRAGMGTAAAAALVTGFLHGAASATA